MNPQITALYELQKQDRRLRRLERRLELIPLRVKELDDDLAKLQAMLEAERRKCDETRSFQRTQEMQLSDEEEQIRSSKARISQVKTSRELNATQRELETTRRMASARSDEIGKLVQGVADAEQRIAAMNESLTQLRAQAEEEKTRLLASRDEVAARLARLRGDRDKLTSQIDRATLTTYERIRRRLDGVAFTAARSQRCTACKMVVPAQIYVAIKKGNDIIACETCGRLLYWSGNFPEEEGGEEEAAKANAPKPAPRKRGKAQADVDEPK
jgi:uncharacterized protein